MLYASLSLVIRVNPHFRISNYWPKSEMRLKH